MTGDVIARIDTFVLRAPTASAFHSSQGRFAGRKSMLVRIETADGVVGWGEGGQYGPAASAVAAIEDVFTPRLLGTQAESAPLAWEQMFVAIRDFGTRGPYVEAMSAIDIALWDVVGQRLGVSVSTLVGGRHRESVAAYGTGFYYPDPDPLTLDRSRMVDDAAAKVAAGFTAVKAKIGLLPVAADAERLGWLRTEVGDDFGIAVDANHGYDLATARRMSARLADLDVLWFEEPVVPEDKASYRRLRDDGTVPVAGGECEFTRYGFAELIEGGCVDIAQPDLGVAGGISEWMRIQSLASVHGVSVYPHVWGSTVAVAAALQVLAATPLNPYTEFPVPLQNEPAIEFDTTDNPLRTEVVHESFRLDGGRVTVPSAPGLGVHVDEDAVRRFAVSR